MGRTGVQKKNGLSLVLAAAVALLSMFPRAARADDDENALFKPDPVFVRILHTNDLHSHFRPDRGVLGLGGIARIKTLIDAIRSSDPDTLVVDGGDWSEGDIYYRIGLGRESLRFMDQLGYDLAVVGNHDWLNGPDRLVQAVREANLRMKVLAANVDLHDYPGADEFRRVIPPYVIREVKGVKIAFIGAITFEYFYKSFFQPVSIADPTRQFKKLVKWLKNEVDSIVVISHNSLEFNKSLLARVPDIDLVVGAHDHVKLTRPIAIKRGKKRPPGWVVETGAWGHYVGETVLQIPRRTHESGARETFAGKSQVQGAAYRLIEVNSSIPEDPEILSRISALEDQVEAEMSEPVFHDHVATSEIDFPLHDGERFLAHLVTDSYRALTGADLAFEHFNFIYSDLAAGDLRTVEAYNVVPPIFNPDTGKTWTVHTFDMKGIHLLAWLNLLFAPKKLGEEVWVNTSGLEITYRPAFFPAWPFFSEAFAALSLVSPFALRSVVSEVLVQGGPLYPDHTYHVAAGEGVIKFIATLNGLGKNLFPVKNLQSTGVEQWRALAQHLRAQSPITLATVPINERLHTKHSDLGVVSRDVWWENASQSPDPTGDFMIADIHVRVRNFGIGPSPADISPQIALFGNRNGSDTALPPDAVPIGPTLPVPQLQKGGSVELTWQRVKIPGSRGLYPVSVVLSDLGSEFNSRNDQTIHWFTGR